MFDDDEPIVRPFFLTRGRTNSDLPIEAMVVATGAAVPDDLAVELRATLAACDEARAVAEVAAEMAIPLGVARVLLGDLLAAGLVIASEAHLEPDEDLLDRLIRGVERL